MRRSEALHGVHGEFLSQIAPERASRVLTALDDIESSNGRVTTEGKRVGVDRDSLVLFNASGRVIGAAVIHRLPAIDMLLDETIDTKARMEFACYLQARVEGYLHGLGHQEYLVVVPLDSEQGWINYIRKMFDSELPGCAVFRRRL